MRISFGKAEGEWASFNEPCGKGDGVKVAFETPFPAKELRGLHVMRDHLIVGPEGLRRVQDLDGNLLRDDPDGYKVSTSAPDAPAVITFDRPPMIGVRVSCSVLGRKPEKGEAFKVLPMTDNVAQYLDEKIPPEMRKRKREENAKLPAVQTFYREAYAKLVVDAYGFVDDAGTALDFQLADVKKAIINQLGALLVGGFAWERAVTLQSERQSSNAAEVSD